MPFVLLLFGIVLFVAGIRNTHQDLWALVKGDFTGDKSFLLFVAAIAIVGGAGYIKPLKGLSVAFMTLLLLVLFLSNKGVIAQLQGFVNNPGPEGGSVGSGVGLNANDNGQIDNLATIQANLKSFGTNNLMVPS